MSDDVIVRYKNIGNFEKTGQAWNGVTAGTDDLSLMDGTYGERTGIKTYKDMWDAGLGKYNSLYERLIIGDGAQYSTERYKMSDGSLWAKTTDNFWQNHNLLSLAWTINDHWTNTATAHYTYGHGYYREFRPNKKLASFGFPNLTDAEGNTVKRSDFVRKKGLSQNTYGLVWNLNYKDEDWDVIGGFSLQQFDGNHFGYVTYAAHPLLAQRIGYYDDQYKYYDSDAEKFDGSAYLKASYNITEQLQVFVDMQYRHVGYSTIGINDRFYEGQNQVLDIDQRYDFVNPKAGFSYTLGRHRFYGSVALSHREPERNNFTDNYNYPFPKAEELTDYELGYTLNGRNYRLGLNAYYMDYTNQFVQTGELSAIGEALTTNIKDSYRMGLELQAGWDPTAWLTLEGNAALSKNQIKDFDEYASVNWDDEFRVIHYDNSTLAFSPSTILNGFVNLHYRGWQAVWHTNFVSRQYLDNTENQDRSLPCYSQSDVALSYATPLKALGVKEAVFGLNLNNVFNRRYAASGWVYSSIVEDYGHPNDNRYYQIGFIPMAGFTMMGSVSLRF